MKQYFAFCGIVLPFVLFGCIVRVSSAEIRQVRVAPFTNPKGKKSQMVLVDWINTGDTPIAVVHADLKGYDSTGKLVWQVPNQIVYASHQAIQPGQSYTDPLSDGFLVLPENPSSTLQPVITHAEARVRKVSIKMKPKRG